MVSLQQIIFQKILYNRISRKLLALFKRRWIWKIVLIQVPICTLTINKSMERINSIESSFLDLNWEIITQSHEDTIRYLMAKDTLRKAKQCEVCTTHMIWSLDSRRLDLYYWRCPIKGHPVASIREGASCIFAWHKKIPLMILARIVYHFASAHCAVVSYKEIIKHTAINIKTVWKVYKEIRQEIAKAYAAHWGLRQLGQGNGVEIDETLFTHTMSEHNRVQVWVFGIYERSTGDIRCFLVENREWNTLAPLIEANISPGTIIYTDGAVVYRRLSEIGYTHYIINHSVAFAEGDLNTNHIESIWSELKAYATIYSKGAPGEKVQEFLCEYIFRRDVRRHNLDFMDELLNII
eukprot:TRINITY_DN8191_c0_g1_i1.p1 TRINITY_DN8191_c0_g1~~TRINITY_DN8191_c0_g1_i1.p1  ORF type:complete len:351 (-),score=-13.02 TRINITY_DN8191_c0_g1_i1:40-1092(-)